MGGNQTEAGDYRVPIRCTQPNRYDLSLVKVPGQESDTELADTVPLPGHPSFTDWATINPLEGGPLFVTSCGCNLGVKSEDRPNSALSAIAAGTSTFGTLNPAHSRLRSYGARFLRRASVQLTAAMGLPSTNSLRVSPEAYSARASRRIKTSK